MIQGNSKEILYSSGEGYRPPHLRRKDGKPLHYLHGGRSEHKLTYSTWRGMKRRCLNKSAHNYKYYGAIGIAVCARWQEPKGKGFINFLADMGERPGAKYTLDRIDPHGNYEKSNCRWATSVEQRHNRRSKTSDR